MLKKKKMGENSGYIYPVSGLCKEVPEEETQTDFNFAATLGFLILRFQFQTWALAKWKVKNSFPFFGQVLVIPGIPGTSIGI